MAVVTLDRLTKIYDRGHAPAADAVSLDIRHGEFMVLLGPSGCGKTTTLRMIAGLESISSGTLSIDGRVVNAVPAKDRDIAMVFQSYALYPHMSVKDNLAFGLRRRAVPRDEIERRVTRRRRDARAVAAARSQAARALRRATAARGARARDRARSEGVPVRRAALQSRRRVARLDARRDRRAASPPRRDDDLRHARSGRGDDHGLAHLHHERRQGGAGRRTARGLPAAGEYFRGELSRQSADEPACRRSSRTIRAAAHCASAHGRSPLPRRAHAAAAARIRTSSSASGRRRFPAARAGGSAIEAEIVQVEPLGAETIFASPHRGRREAGFRARRSRRCGEGRRAASARRRSCRRACVRCGRKRAPSLNASS